MAWPDRPCGSSRVPIERSLSPSPPSPQKLEHELIFAGLVGLMDPPRPEVAEAIRRCHDAWYSRR
jgi:magnesium-transporting ATPase (P-type)